MKIFRYLDNHDMIHYAYFNDRGEAIRLDGELGSLKKTQDPANVKDLLPPLVPVTIYAIGPNYKGYIHETGGVSPEYPVVMMKPPSSVQSPEAPIVLPRHLRSNKVDYEGALAVVIGKLCRNVSKANALDYVWGYTCANDISARDWQFDRSGGQFIRAKGFDTFCPLGPCMVTTNEITDPNDLNIRTTVNGEVVQESNTADVLFDVATLIEFLSGSTTLFPGTVILTGTPQGIGNNRKPPRYLQAGDVVVVDIEGIGPLENSVQEEVLVPLS